MSLGRIIIKMIVGRVGGRGEKMLMRCVFLFYGGTNYKTCYFALVETQFRYSFTRKRYRS